MFLSYLLLGYCRLSNLIKWAMWWKKHNDSIVLCSTSIVFTLITWSSTLLWLDDIDNVTSLLTIDWLMQRLTCLMYSQRWVTSDLIQHIIVVFSSNSMNNETLNIACQWYSLRTAVFLLRRACICLRKLFETSSCEIAFSHILQNSSLLFYFLVLSPLKICLNLFQLVLKLSRPTQLCACF